MRVTPPVIGQKGIVAFQQQTSVQQALDNQVDFAYQTHLDTNGWVDLFANGNIKCTLVRVGATGTTPPSQQTWTATNTKISHNLGRQPIGWIIVYKDKVCDIHAGTTKPDTQFMYLTISDDTANTTLLLF